jgi:hypothetical protein
VLTAALVIGALLAVAAVWFVARPFLGREPDTLPDEPPPERLALEEQRDRALAALKELEFDHRTGKISDEDYRSLVGDLRREAAEALKALDRGTPRQMRTPETAVPEQVPVPVPEPSPAPSDPPGPVVVPEPEPVPHEPPGPVVVPEPQPPEHSD